MACAGDTMCDSSVGMVKNAILHRFKMLMHKRKNSRKELENSAIGMPGQMPGNGCHLQCITARMLYAWCHHDG